MATTIRGDQIRLALGLAYDATTRELLYNGSLKSSVIAASTGNINLTTHGLAAVDGVTPIAGDRILVKDQSSPTQEGVYIAAVGAWARAADWVTGDDVRGAVVYVGGEGTLNGDTAWSVTAATAVVNSHDPLFLQNVTQVKTAGGLAFDGTDGQLELGTLTQTFTVGASGLMNVASSGAVTVQSGGVLTVDAPGGLIITDFPTATTHGANKAYVDSVASGLDVKESVRALTEATLVANASTTGTPTYDPVGGASTRGQISAVLASSDVFTVDAVTLGAAQDGTRILLRSEGLGTSQVHSVDTVADVTDSLDGTFWVWYATPNQAYYVWYDTPAGGVDPAPSPPGGVTYTGIQVSIIQNETANDVATKTETAINGATINGGGPLVLKGTNDLTITNARGGAVTNVAEGSSPTGFTIATDTPGTGLGPAANGIWTTTISGTTLTLDRATDFDEDSEVTAGAFTFIEEGTVNADSGWVLTSNDPVTIGGSAGTTLTFVQFSGAGQIIAGAGMTKTGNTLNVIATDASLLVAADDMGVQLDATTGAGISGLAITGNGVHISASAAGNGVTGGGGSALAVEPNVTDGGAQPGLETATNGVRVSTGAAGNGITGGGGVALAVEPNVTDGGAVPGLETAVNGVRIATTAAGGGLIGGGGAALSIGAGDGITVNVDDVAVSAENGTIRVSAAGVAVNHIKYPVRVTTTIDLLGAPHNATYTNNVGGAQANGRFTNVGSTVDGVAFAQGDRVLVKNQTNLDENGIYIVQATTTTWDRVADFDETVEVFPGVLVVVDEGTANANTAWMQSEDIVNVGGAAGSNIAFSQVGGSTLLGGDGIDITGSTVSVDVFNEDLTSQVGGGTPLVFDLTAAPASINSTDALMVFFNGMLQQGGGVDYTLLGTEVTFSSAPVPGDVILVTYWR